ncbi:TetR/AcrR family transcriptional regulator [Actinomycetes bacterium M1A6_2h]
MPKVVDHASRRVEVAKAVWAVVERDGVNAASVRNVAAECGWTYGMIAHYFKSRDELLLFAYRLALARELECAPGIDQEPDPVSRLMGVLLRALPVDEQAALDVRIWLGFMGRVADEPALARAVLEEHRDYHDRVLRLIRECLEADRISSNLPAESLLQHVVVYVDGLGVSATLDPTNFGRSALEPILSSFLEALGFDVAGSPRASVYRVS